MKTEARPTVVVFDCRLPPADKKTWVGWAACLMSGPGSRWNQPPPHPLVQSRERSQSEHPKRRALHIAGNSQLLSTDELAIVRHCYCRPALSSGLREREKVSSLRPYRLPSTPIAQCQFCRDCCRRCWRQVNRDKGSKPTTRSRARRKQWTSTKTADLSTTTGLEQSSCLRTGLIVVRPEVSTWVGTGAFTLQDSGDWTRKQQITSRDPLSAKSCRRPTRTRPPSARRNFHAVEGAVSAAATDCSLQRLHQRHHQPTSTRCLKQPP